ncbi:MAG: hypothetical protein EOP66_10255, partial [Sphingomonas sp.]
MRTVLARAPIGRIGTSGLLAALLAGCAIPAANTAVQPVSTLTLGLATDPAPVIAADWWRSFGDPQLDRLVRDAVAGSPSLDAALARVAQAQAVLSTRRADNGPDVTLDAQEQLARLSGRYTIPPPYAGSTRFVGSTRHRAAGSCSDRSA